MAWMWRGREISDLTSAIAEFVKEIDFKKGDLLGPVYTNEVPPSFRDVGLGSAPLSESEVAELVGATAPPPDVPQLDSVVANIEDALTKQHVVLAPGLVERIVGGWLVGDIVVLVGATGTGKSFLSRTLSNALTDLFGDQRFFSVFLEVSPDYDIGQFLGYENLAGEFTAGRFASDVLFVGEASDPRLVVLDEWNLAQIDAYFAPILSSIESHVPLRLPGRVNLKSMSDDQREQIVRAQPGIVDGQWSVPENTLFLATCNSWTDEPETRLPISGPVKRRCRIITMPNVLDLALQEKGQQGIVDACNTMLQQELTAIDERTNSGVASVWDKHRKERLTVVPTVDRLGDTGAKLVQISRALLQNPQTKGNFTPGILRDILLSSVYASPGREFAALGQQVADKVLHQVSGVPTILETLTTLSKEFPNAKEIDDLARRMGAFSGERRIRPLV
jgi:energy-coupling factor transporter ATP-binding protein EcfA2